MAKPIRNTPILTDRDAFIFRRENANLPPLDERKKEWNRIAQSVEQLKAMITALPQ
ncbi:MAG: hypothetical protein K2J78_06700 [Muribaculaceae bacterium]|nr:hypothetical protein [Muribaculaceae bacterium]MDE6769394.1 hypothetical protein [Muribaculaceae bacterium]